VRITQHCNLAHADRELSVAISEADLLLIGRWCREQTKSVQSLLEHIAESGDPIFWG
jgi:hypothetical protein